MNLNEFPIIISLESYEISKTLRKLKISSYCFNLLVNALKYTGKSFPDKKNFCDLNVECICVGVKKVSFVCYTKKLILRPPPHAYAPIDLTLSVRI